jgi:tight adherence protein C
MTSPVLGAWLGAAAAAGGWLVVLGLASLRRPSLETRLRPYLADVLDAAPPATVRRAGGPSLRGLLAAAVTVAARRLDSFVGGRAAVELRLDQLGPAAGGVERFRVEQVVWGGAAVGFVVSAGVLRALTGDRPDPFALLVVAVAAGTGAVVARDRRLSRAVRRRRAAIQQELPVVAELVALAVAAGEGPPAALARAARSSSGPLGQELARTIADVRAGRPLVDALRTLAARHELVPLVRFVDGVVVAVERGTPLAEVLRAQAVDAREQARRDLMEQAARREVAMLLPVVLLVLPVSVCFALFPGFYGLSLHA